MADWIHCNNCFRQPGQGLSLALTSCGHIFCGQCASSCCKETCKLCKTKCQTISLRPPLKPDVEVFFMDPLELLKRNSRMAVRVIQFQRSHRHRMVSFLKNQVAKTRKIVLEAKAALEKAQSIGEENVKLREENALLKKYLKERAANPNSSPNVAFGHVPRTARNDSMIVRGNPSPTAPKLAHQPHHGSRGLQTNVTVLPHSTQHHAVSPSRGGCSSSSSRHIGSYYSISPRPYNTNYVSPSYSVNSDGSSSVSQQSPMNYSQSSTSNEKTPPLDMSRLSILPPSEDRLSSNSALSSLRPTRHDRHATTHPQSILQSFCRTKPFI